MRQTEFFRETLAVFELLFVSLRAETSQNTIRMQGKDIIDYSDNSLFEDSEHMPLPDEKEFYTPEEAYELVMNDVQSIYFMKNAI